MLRGYMKKSTQHHKAHPSEGIGTASASASRCGLVCLYPLLQTQQNLLENQLESLVETIHSSNQNHFVFALRSVEEYRTIVSSFSDHNILIKKTDGGYALSMVMQFYSHPSHSLA